MVLIYSPAVSCRNSTVTYFGSNTHTPRRGNGQIFTTAISSTAWARCSTVISSPAWCSFLPEASSAADGRGSLAVAVQVDP
jgi:hypothetical protein